ncbi:MAG: hypothetical protein R6W77_13575 [Trueperaceae bacterium]
MNGDEGDLRPQGTPQGASLPDELLADFVLGTLDASEASSVAATVATDPTVARRVAGIGRALEALALDLEPVELPPAGLDRLLREARGVHPGAADDASLGAATTSAATATSAAASAWDTAVASPARSAARSVTARPTTPPLTSAPARPRAVRRGATVVVGVLVVALVALVGTFATFQAASVAELREEQRVLAYWMAIPDMTLISLEAPAGAGDDAWSGSDAAWAGSDEASEPDDTGHLGVVCLLPDGRGLVLRPYPAPPGGWYQVVGTGPEGEIELARSGGNVLTFDARGIERVEVRVLDARRSGVAGALDRVASLLGGRPAAMPDGVGDGVVVAQARLP